MSAHFGTGAAQAQQADLAVTMTVNNPNPIVGDTITFTITLPNNGPNDATGVALTDLLPPAVTFVGATPSQGTYNPATGLWTAGSIVNGAIATLTLQAQVNSASQFVNTASITASDQTDPNLANNSDSVQVPPGQPADLAITKIASNANPNVGQTFNYTITLNNVGPGNASNVTVADVLPAGLTFQSATPSQGTYNAGTGIWTIGTVASGAATTLTLAVVRASANAITNTAAVASMDQFDPNPGNDSASVVTPAVPGADLLIAKSASNPSPTVGQSLTYTITVVNLGPDAATGVTVNDPLPAGLTFAGATPSQGSYDSGTGIWTIGTVANGAAPTLTLTVTVSVGGQITNTAMVAAGTPDPNPGNNTASAIVNAASLSTATTLTSSANPSTGGQAVTFTATVTSGSGTPAGTVTFRDGGNVIGTASLVSGVAAFTTSSLAVGSHSITASYGGAPGFNASTSAALIQVVNVHPDSVRLRALQLAVTKMVAQSSGNAISTAVGDAIADGFSDDGGELMRPNGTGLRINFSAEPDPNRPTRARSGAGADYDPVIAARSGVMPGSGGDPLSASPSGLPSSLRSFAPQPFASQPSTPTTRVDDAFASLAYSDPMVTKAPPRRSVPKEWLLWADVRGTGWNTEPSAGDIRGGQVNAIIGLTRRLTPDLLMGVLGGWETFNYRSETLNGRLKGDGWTVGAYLGWRLWAGLRFDAAIARSEIAYDGLAGIAAGSFSGERWLASAGLTGTYRLERWVIEPSAKVYALWEHEGAYIDSLGTQQGENEFSTGRASGGAKVAYPMAWDGLMTFAPYVGLYADYYFSSSGTATLLLPTEFVQGWSARVAGGFSFNTAGGAKAAIGGELGGLGNDFTTWSVRGRASVPF